MDTGFSYEYIPWRGVSKDTMAVYGIKTKLDSQGKPLSIGFPYSNGSFKVRQFEDKAFHSVGDMKAGLFGKDKFPLGSHKYITITEGELDAASLYQVIKSPVVSVRSASSARSDCAFDRAYLNSFERIYLAFDSDSAGREASSSVAKLFDYGKVYDVRFDPARKDANGYLQVNAVDDLRNLWWNSRKFLPDNIISVRSELKKELFKPITPGIPYPWQTLSYMTGGLRTGETVLITAPEGVGKTEISHAILHNLLKGTKDAVGAIFLEESKQRLLQALCGLQLRRRLNIAGHGCSNAEIERAFDELVPTDDRLPVYSHYGSDDPDVILDTIRYFVSALGCRFVVFDLISLAVSAASGDREEKALSYLSGRLALSTQELDYGLILVSHVNDFGQTRGSRMIGKDCHIRIDLSRDTLAVDDKTKRTTTLSIPKNRPNSLTGFAGSLVFDPVTGILTEDLGSEALLHAGIEDITDALQNAA